MSAAFDNAIGYVAASPSTTHSFPNMTLGVGTDKLIVVGLSVGSGLLGGPPAITSVKWNTTETLSQVRAWTQSSTIRGAIFALQNPTSGTHKVDVVLGSSAFIAGGTQTWFGIDQSGTAVRNTKRARGTAGSSSIVITTLSGDLVVDHAAVDGLHTATIGTGIDQRYAGGTVGGLGYGGCSGFGGSKIATGATQTMKYTYSTPPTPDFVHVGFSIKPSGAAPGVAHLLPLIGAGN